MRQLTQATAILLALGLTASPALGQTQAAQSGTPTQDVNPATTTASGTTGIWFVPTAEVLANKRWSISLYETSFNYDPGFTNTVSYPVTFGVGLGGRAEFFGSVRFITRIDRDAAMDLRARDEKDGTSRLLMPRVGRHVEVCAIDAKRPMELEWCERPLETEPTVELPGNDGVRRHPQLCDELLDVSRM